MLIRTLTVIGAALAASAAAHGAGNLLVNGDLEEPFGAASGTDDTVGWTLLEPDLDDLGAAVNSATFANFANHTPGGDRGLWLRSFEGGLGGDGPATVNASLFQHVAVQPGTVYRLGAWFNFDPNYTSAGTKLSLSFFNAAMDELSGVSLDINAHNAFDGVWRRFTLSAVADPTAAFARVQVEMIDGALVAMNPQSAYVDDFELVPSPGAGALLAAAGLIGASRRRR
jgi:hypothetical protein